MPERLAGLHAERTPDQLQRLVEIAALRADDAEQKKQDRVRGLRRHKLSVDGFRLGETPRGV